MSRRFFPFVGLLALAACSSGVPRDTVATQPSSTIVIATGALPAVPSIIQTPLGSVPVRFQLDPRDENDSTPLYGSFSRLDRVITIRAGMNPANTWVTLHHELFHELMQETHMPLPPPVEEALADHVAVRLTWELINHTTPGCR